MEATAGAWLLLSLNEERDPQLSLAEGRAPRARDELIST